jgi:hypothetical protein
VHGGASTRHREAGRTQLSFGGIPGPLAGCVPGAGMPDRQGPAGYTGSRGVAAQLLHGRDRELRPVPGRRHPSGLGVRLTSGRDVALELAAAAEVQEGPRRRLVPGALFEQRTRFRVPPLREQPARLVERGFRLDARIAGRGRGRPARHRRLFFDASWLHRFGTPRGRGGNRHHGRRLRVGFRRRGGTRHERDGKNKRTTHGTSRRATLSGAIVFPRIESGHWANGVPKAPNRLTFVPAITDPVG